MKRLFIALTMLLTTVSMSSFANTTEVKNVQVASSVLAAFKNNFTTASEVKWTAGQDFYKAQFSLNGQYLTAFYSLEGDMMALTRNIASTQLPLALQTSLKQNYSEFWISDLFEIATEEGTFYYITLESADAQVVLKSDNSSWSTFQKQSKS